jgi:hypothetical protein
VWFPRGSLPMGTTPVSFRHDTVATPSQKPTGAGVAWVGASYSTETAKNRRGSHNLLGTGQLAVKPGPPMPERCNHR